jgi:hypothetical protein
MAAAAAIFAPCSRIALLAMVASRFRVVETGR